MLEMLLTEMKLKGMYLHCIINNQLIMFMKTVLVLCNAEAGICNQVFLIEGHLIGEDITGTEKRLPMCDTL